MMSKDLMASLLGGETMYEGVRSSIETAIRIMKKEPNTSVKKAMFMGLTLSGPIFMMGDILEMMEEVYGEEKMAANDPKLLEDLLKSMPPAT